MSGAPRSALTARIVPPFKVVRSAIPSSAILLPAAFFLSVLRPTATRPNALIYLAYVGAVLLALGLIVLGVGLL